MADSFPANAVIVSSVSMGRKIRKDTGTRAQVDERNFTTRKRELDSLVQKQEQNQKKRQKFLSQVAQTVEITDRLAVDNLTKAQIMKQLQYHRYVKKSKLAIAYSKATQPQQIAELKRLIEVAKMPNPVVDMHQEQDEEDLDDLLEGDDTLGVGD